MDSTKIHGLDLERADLARIKGLIDSVSARFDKAEAFIAPPDGSDDPVVCIAFHRSGLHVGLAASLADLSVPGCIQRYADRADYSLSRANLSERLNV